MREIAEREVDLSHACADGLEQRCAARCALGQYRAVDPFEYAYAVTKTRRPLDRGDVRAFGCGHDFLHQGMGLRLRRAAHGLVLKVEQVRQVLPVCDLEDELSALEI